MTWSVCEAGLFLLSLTLGHLQTVVPSLSLSALRRNVLNVNSSDRRLSCSGKKQLRRCLPYLLNKPKIGRFLLSICTEVLRVDSFFFMASSFASVTFVTWKLIAACVVVPQWVHLPQVTPRRFISMRRGLCFALMSIACPWLCFMVLRSHVSRISGRPLTR